MASTRTAWGRSLQPMSENGALAPPRAIRVAPSRIIRAQMSFGIMPAPGNASVPNGRSPLTASTASAAAMAALPAIWSARGVMVSQMTSPFDPSDRMDRVLDPLGIGVPEGTELCLIEVLDILADVRHQLLEFGRHHCGPLEVADLGHDGLRRALGREQADPQVELKIVAELFHGRHVRQRVGAFRAEGSKRPRLATLDLAEAGGNRRYEDLGIIADQRGERRTAAVGRQMAQLYAGRLEVKRHRQMQGAIKAG